MTQNEAVEICTAALKTGFTGLLVQALKQTHQAEALKILDDVQSGKSTLRFGMTVNGRVTELTAHLTDNHRTREIFVVALTDPPAPTVN